MKNMLIRLHLAFNLCKTNFEPANIHKIQWVTTNHNDWLR